MSAATLVAAPIGQESIRTFALAGKATFTVRGKRERFTIKIVKPKKVDGPVTHFVKVLTGSDNQNSYTYVGQVYANGSYSHGAKSPIAATAPSAVAAKWVVERIVSGKPLNNCEVWHEGVCGRCGRPLTVPESIESGFGPECINKI